MRETSQYGVVPNLIDFPLLEFCCSTLCVGWRQSIGSPTCGVGAFWSRLVLESFCSLNHILSYTQVSYVLLCQLHTIYYLLLKWCVTIGCNHSLGFHIVFVMIFLSIYYSLLLSLIFLFHAESQSAHWRTKVN